MKTLLSVCFALMAVYLVALGISTMRHDYETAVALAGPMTAGQTTAERACVLAGIIEKLQLLTPAPDCDALAFREAQTLAGPAPEGRTATEHSRVITDIAVDIMAQPAAQ